MIGGTIGVRYARSCQPNDLWTSYFTSSKEVKKFREENGEPDVIEVRQTFNDSLQAREWEHKVLRRLRVIQNDKWMNRGTGKSIPPQFGRFHSDETKRKMSERAKSIHTKDKTISEKRIASYKKTTSSLEWKIKKSKSVIKSCTEERNRKVAIGVSKSWNSEKDKRVKNIRKTLNSTEYKLSKRCSCIICHKETNVVGLTRFHRHNLNL